MERELLFRCRKVNHEKRFVDSGDGHDRAGAHERVSGSCARRLCSRPWNPGYFAPYNVYPNLGEVKLDTKVRDAQVFINGAYSGTTHENRTMRLRPGTYNIEIREGSQTPFSQKIFVVAGKTMHLHPEL